MKETPLIHLESFNRKEDALLWLGKNYIEGAFIELGSSLKSIDIYGVSGKFNVVVEYNDVLKGINTLKSIIKSPVFNVDPRTGSRYIGTAEGAATQGEPDNGYMLPPGAGGTRNYANAVNMGRLINRAARAAGTGTGAGAGVGAVAGSGAGAGVGAGSGASTPGTRSSGSTPNAFDLYEQNKNLFGNPINNFPGFNFNRKNENPVGSPSAATPVGSSSSAAPAGSPSTENPIGSSPTSKNTPAQEENERKRGAGIWSRLGRALLPAALAFPLILGGWTGNETPINFPKEPTGRGHTIEILNPDTPETQKPPVAQRVNLFDTPTTKKPPTEKPPTAATTPDKNVVEKAVYMVIKSLIERGVIA
jgi:hypothetical protein